MENKRRIFLQKLGFVFGALAIPDFGWTKPTVGKFADFTKVKHLGLPILKFSRTWFKKDSSSEFLILTDTQYPTIPWSNFRGSVPDVILYGGKNKIELPNDSIKLPLVNSNLIDRPELVSDFLILNRSDKKIGVLGIGFGDNSPKISDTIRILNEKSAFLKEEAGCDQVFVLVEDPKSYHLPVSFSELVEGSHHADYFFATCSESKSHKLMVLRNASDKEVFLSIQSRFERKDPFLQFKNNVFSSYNKG